VRLANQFGAGGCDPVTISQSVGDLGQDSVEVATGDAPDKTLFARPPADGLNVPPIRQARPGECERGDEDITDCR